MIYDTINDMLTNAGSPEGMILAGRYRVVRQLGQGGMGSVWLVEDAQLDGRRFAVKMLPSILVNNKRAYRQLKDEALVAMRLSHENIVTLRAFEENGGNPFLVMDYVEGQTLDDYLAEKGTLTEDEVIRVMRPIAAALDYAHGKGVVHRDVKPGNVMIAKDGTPYILDFGIAREMQETVTRVTGKLSSGTLLYMSPEQLMGDPPKPEQDVYSFAAMVYECLKGEPPFVRGAIEDQIKNKPPEPLAEVGATGSLPACVNGPAARSTSIAASVMAGLEKKPGDRPSSCMAVLEGKNVHAEHAERVEGGNGRVRSPNGPQSGGPRSVAAVKGLLAAALIVVFAGGAWWWLGGRNGTSGANGTTVTEKAQVLGVPDVPSAVTNYLPPSARPPDAPVDKKDKASGATNTPPVGKPTPGPVLDPRTEIMPVLKPVVITNEVVHVVTNEIVHVVTNEVVRVVKDSPSPPQETPVPVEQPAPEPVPAPEVASSAFTVGDLEALDVSALRPGEGREVKLSCGVVLALNWCPPGEFGMQSPSRRVQFPTGFWMGRYEVTQALWNGVMPANPSTFHGLNMTNAPVDSVSRDDCLRFVAELNRQNSTEGFRLPSDAQWEYACRAGTFTPFHYGATGSLAEMCARSHAPQKTGMFKPNAWGLYDMHGNMAEWCDDPYPRELLNFFQRDMFNRGGFVLRGGSYKDRETNCTASSRRREAGIKRHPTFGMRLCFSPR